MLFTKQSMVDICQNMSSVPYVEYPSGLEHILDFFKIEHLFTLMQLSNQPITWQLLQCI